MNDLNVRAVMIGSLVDILGSFILGGVVFALIGAFSGAQTPEDLDIVYSGSLPLQVLTLVLGLLMTATGAYVAARLVSGTERLHAFAVGIVSTVVGFTIVFASPEASPFWAQAISLMLTIPAAFSGGEVRRLTTAGRRRA